MQKTMIKSIFAVAVVGAFSATAFAAMPSVDNGSGVADVTKINNNFTTLDNSKLDKSIYANNALLVNSKLAEKVDTATFNTKLNALLLPFRAILTRIRQILLPTRNRSTF